MIVDRYDLERLIYPPITNASYLSRETVGGMMSDARIPWDYVILGAIRSGLECDLQEIYDTIAKFAENGSYVVNKELFAVEQRWGERPRYYHAVRPAVISLLKRGLVVRVARGRYQITDAGRIRLKELEELY